MKLSDQVISLDLAKRLKELGVKQESIFYWMKYTVKKTGEMFWEMNNRGLHTPNAWSLITNRTVDARIVHSDWEDQYAAFTVAELGEMLPSGAIEYYKLVRGGWHLTYRRNGAKPKVIEGETEAEARGLMVAYLIENNLITV